ncbi:hypothetical protein KSP39_PZI018383 [Platanthera zijinensis]|uniref:Uncharacterized protein n=1 Tax=Platanthera zijinensis TaxID=2320716 RepID=A0AAP0B3U8_9ASPA
MENRQSEQSQNLSRWEDEMLKLRLAIQQSTEQTTQEMRLLLQDMRFLLKASTSDNHFHNFQGEVRSIPLATKESYYDKPGQMHYRHQIGPGHSSTAPWAAHWGAHPQIFEMPPPNMLGQPSSVGVSWSHAAVTPSSYGTAIGPSACTATIVPSSYGGTAVPSARAANIAPSACVATIAPNLCGATAALPNATLLPNPNTSIGDAHSKRIIEDKHKISDDTNTRVAANLKKLDDLIAGIEEEEQETIKANNLFEVPITANIVSSPIEVLSFAPFVLDNSDTMTLPLLEELTQHHPNSNVIMGSLASITQVGQLQDDTCFRSHVSTWTIHVFDPGGCTISIHYAQVEPPINKFQDAGFVLIYIPRVIWVFDAGGIKRRGRRLNGKGRNVTAVSHVARR